jgi:hypothetical protein
MAEGTSRSVAAPRPLQQQQWRQRKQDRCHFNCFTGWKDRCLAWCSSIEGQQQQLARSAYVLNECLATGTDGCAAATAPLQQHPCNSTPATAPLAAASPANPGILSHLYSAVGPPCLTIARSTSSIPGPAAALLPPPPAAAAAAAASCAVPAICIRRETVSSGNATIWPLHAATTPQQRLAPMSGSRW